MIAFLNLTLVILLLGMVYTCIAILIGMGLYSVYTAIKEIRGEEM